MAGISIYKIIKYKYNLWVITVMLDCVSPYHRTRQECSPSSAFALSA